MEKMKKRFGTISGVFIPSVLTIFGVILFYREGWVIANAGLLGGLLIILMANFITFTTALSMSSIATNIKVEGGGTYFLISRNLGPEIGGAIGIALFFAQAFSIAFYIIGFTMALQRFFPNIPAPVLNLITLAVLTLLSIFSAEIAIKAQYIILALVLVAIVSFMIGNLRFDVQPQIMGSFQEGGFWLTFAIFFPAVTGIDVGISLSGDLRDPSKNIPRGSISAILFTFLIYAVIALWFAFNFEPNQIFGKDLLMIETAKIPILVVIGIWAATISSAIGMLLGAPRTLQALARDGIVPRFLGKGSGPANEPRVAMIFSIALATILLVLGNIDFVAQLLTMFFLASYGIANIVAGMERLIGNPSFRPTFKTPMVLSFLGGFAAFACMFLIDALVTVVAIIIIAFIYAYNTRRRLESNWGDIRKGFWASRIEFALRNYEKFAEHPRNWRPHFAILENDKSNRFTLAKFASDLAGKGGLIADYIFIDKTIEQAFEIAETEKAEFQDFVDKNNFYLLYPEVVITDKQKEPAMIAIQADGLRSFKANTLISDFSLDNNSLHNHFANLARYDLLKKNVILIKNHLEEYVSEDRIDVWISGFKANLSMMLLIPVMLTKADDWSKTKICIRMVVENDTLKKTAEENIGSIVEESRINAEVDVISLGIDKNPEDIGGETQIIPRQKKIKFGKGSFLSKFVNFISNFDLPKPAEKTRDEIQEIIANASQNARLVVLTQVSQRSAKKVNFG